MERDFPDGVAVVVGGSGGIGGAICDKLAEAGADVVLTYRSNRERAEAVAERVRAHGRTAETRALSIGDRDGVVATMDAIAKQQRIHTVVVAAGSDIEQLHIHDLGPEQWQQVIDADLNGFFHVVHATLGHLRAGGGGSYVHIGSAGIQRWPARDVLSVVPKAAIESLLQGIAKEEGRFGIRANSVLTGVIETGIFLRLLEQGVFDEAWKQAVLATLALPRWGSADEVADVATFLASRRAGYVTGQQIAVDGGYGV